MIRATDYHTMTTFEQPNHQNCWSTQSLSAISHLNYRKDAMEGSGDVWLKDTYRKEKQSDDPEFHNFRILIVSVL